MKRTVISIATAFALLITMAMPCFASENSIEREYEYYDDGSYAIIETAISTPYDISFIGTYSTSSKRATRTYTYYGATNKKEWDMTLDATFEYTGTKATATKSSMDYTIYVTGWSCSSKSATKSGATAKASGTFKYKTVTRSKSIGLKCSKSGVISHVD